MKTEDMNHILSYFQIHDDLETEHWVHSKTEFPAKRIYCAGSQWEKEMH